MKTVESRGMVPVREAIRWGASLLREAGIGREDAAGEPADGGCAAGGLVAGEAAARETAAREAAAREAAVLLSHCTGHSVAGLYTSLDGIPADAMARYRVAIERRRAREPLQYITGVQEFMSLEFRVNQSVLIPRPETEILVETVVEFLRGWRDEGPARDLPRFADAGTGSGAIAVSVAKYAGCGGYGLDASGDALDVARLNARLHGVGDRLEFLEGDLLEPLARLVKAGRGEAAALDCVVSNPPYIPRGEYERLQPEVREFEPRIALLCDDVSEFYRRLARQAACFLRPGGLLAVEVGYNQADSVERVFAASGLYGAVRRKEDLRGIGRVVYCNLEQSLDWSSVG
ncbi:MAG: peptide chain release factor N(5)-glutamine methyltransferase [Bacillota bacterium]